MMGRQLVPKLVARGHSVTATTTSPGKLGLVEQLGADAVVMDGLNAASDAEAVAKAREHYHCEQQRVAGRHSSLRTDSRMLKA
jgi:nucleoside-diphosphate-sugar epimerase